MSTACDLFTAAVNAFRRSDIPAATALLRRGFFENLYVSPLVLEEEFYPQDIWYASAESEPRAAREYVRRYGKLWSEDSAAVEFMREVWSDPLVRAELRNFINVSKNLLLAADAKLRDGLLRERSSFVNPERIKRTQEEILDRLERLRLRVPVPQPKLSLLLLAARDPAASVAFYRDLLGVDPVSTGDVAGGYAEFQFEGVQLAIHGYDRVGAGDPYGLGPPPESLGWGALFVFTVGRLARYRENAEKAGIPIVDASMDPPRPGAPKGGARFFVVRDPSGYLIELTETDARGLEEGD